MSELDDPEDRAVRLAAEAVDALAASQVLQSRLAHATWHVESLRSSLDGAQSRLVEYREALEESQAALGRTQEELGRTQEELGRSPGSPASSADQSLVAGDFPPARSQETSSGGAAG